MREFLSVVILSGALALGHGAEARVFETSAGKVDVARVAGPFEHPWAVTFLDSSDGWSGDMLVTERPGRMWLANRDGLKSEISGVPKVSASGQGGLLDVVAAKDFATSGTVFLSYAEPADGGARTAVARARLDRAAGALRDLDVIFRMSPVVNSKHHFGSRIVEAPDGALFITLGERGQRDQAQELSTHLGKVVHIMPDGSIPAGNPFIRQDNALPEIWSYGHRNPQGAAMGPDGTLWTVEHGARGGDEINHPQPGKNYGWPVISYGTHYTFLPIGEGTEKEGMEQPVHYWDPSIAPSGLTVYDGDLFPDWRGDLLVGALKFQLIARLDLEDGKVMGEERLFEGEFGRIRDVRTGPDGAIWFLTDESEGALYRMAPAGR
jgi:glucose/arabinose dehydrogenase